MGSQTTFIHFHPNVFELQVAFPSSVSGRKISFAMEKSRQQDETLSVEAARAEAFARCVLSEAGLDGDAYRGAPLVRRVPACLRALGVTTLSRARAKVRGDERARDLALNALLVGVTEFYRDREAFYALEREIDTRQEFFKDCRVWSAGCSLGAEGYTLAMMLYARGVLDKGQVTGTDCRPSAVAHAREGRYAPSLCEGLPERYREFFAKSGEELEISGVIKARTRWWARDVLEGPGTMEKFHVVSCRNLSIYLNRSDIQRLWVCLYDSLLPGGVLFTGHAEIPFGCPGLTRIARCLYRKESRV